MGGIIAFLTSKIAGPVFGGLFFVTAIGFAVTVGVYHFELKAETSRADKLDASINAPGTGYIARNTQCETNVSTLGVGLDRARADVQRLANDTLAADKRNAASMASALQQVAAVKASSAKLLALPATAPIGSIAACTAGAKILKTGAAP